MALVVPQLFELVPKGGPGSGNFGHGGRPGKRGGSATGTGGRKRAVGTFSAESVKTAQAFHDLEREHGPEKDYYWHRAEDAAGIDRQAARMMTGTWNQMTHSVGQMQLQEAAAKEFELERPEWHKVQGVELQQRREKLLAEGKKLPMELKTIEEQALDHVKELDSTPYRDKFTSVPTSHIKGSEDLWRSHGSEEAGIRAYLRASYNLTQSELKDAGIKEVSVYRGVRTDTPLGKPGETLKITSQSPMVSWSSDKSMGLRFAEMKKTKQKVKLPKHGSILQTSIPAKDILSIFGTGVGAEQESEFIVLGRQGHVAEITSTH